jgi:hypothetical protein
MREEGRGERGDGERRRWGEGEMGRILFDTIPNYCRRKSFSFVPRLCL